MPQRSINVNQSIRVLKFLWSTLYLDQDEITTSYYSQTQNSITNLAGTLSLPAPFLKSTSKLKVLLKCVRSYLSCGNIETNLDAWITAVDGEDAGNKADVRHYLRGLTAPPEDTIILANYLLSGIEYLENKVNLAHASSEKHDAYNSDYVESDLLQNQVIRGSKSKAVALKHIDDAITANDECFQLFRRYFIKEPSRDPFEGAQILLGRIHF